MGQGVSGHHLDTSGGNGDKSSQKDLLIIENTPFIQVRLCI